MIITPLSLKIKLMEVESSVVVACIARRGISRLQLYIWWFSRSRTCG